MKKIIKRDKIYNYIGKEPSGFNSDEPFFDG